MSQRQHTTEKRRLMLDLLFGYEFLMFRVCFSTEKVFRELPLSNETRTPVPCAEAGRVKIAAPFALIVVPIITVAA